MATSVVVTVGRNALLDLTFASGWFIGLVDNSGFTQYAATDTTASHTGWVESVAYAEASRPAYSPASASAGSITNTSAKAVFSITSTVTIRGAFLVTNLTKSATTGTLYGVGDFTVARSVIIGNVLHVTIVLTD